MGDLFAFWSFLAVGAIAIAITVLASYALTHGVKMPRLLYIAIVTSVWVICGAFGAWLNGFSIVLMLYWVVYSGFIGLISSVLISLIIFKKKK